MRVINDAGLALLQSFEKCKLLAYQDSGGVWTIGWGHCGPEVVPGLVWTQKQADDQLRADLGKFETIDHYVSEQVNDNQFSAMVCLAYNIGLGAFKLSSLLKTINEGNSPDREWLEWDHVKGVPNAGLLRRRQAELALFHKLG